MLIMQRKHQFPTDSNARTARPPPVPPRPDKNLVADALAKTRKTPYHPEKESQKEEPANVSPKLNGLSRVKSFIRDVISDKKSNEEKKQNSPTKNTSGKNSSSQLPVSSTFKSQNGKKAKEAPVKKSLVRSLSSSLKSDKNGIQNSEKKIVSKSNSFAEKAFPMRRAPPPPVSPKPAKKHSEKLIRNPKLSASCEELNRSERPIVYQSKLPKTVVNNATNILDNATVSITTAPSSESEKEDSAVDYVTRKLISELIEANKPENAKQKEATKNKTTVTLNREDSSPKKVKTEINDISNHELLISELESMRREKTCETPSSSISRQSSVQSFSFSDCDANACLDDVSQPFVIPSDLACRLQEQFSSSQRMAALRGLPPLPKSLSGFSDVLQRVGGGDDDSPILANLPEDAAARLAVNGTNAEAHRRVPTTLDTQLAVLRREMLSLRRLDLSLLSQLWTLNEAIHDWRQEVDLRRLSGGSAPLRPAPPPPSPPPLSPLGPFSPFSPSDEEEASSRSVGSGDYVSS